MHILYTALKAITKSVGAMFNHQGAAVTKAIGAVHGPGIFNTARRSHTPALSVGAEAGPNGHAPGEGPLEHYSKALREARHPSFLRQNQHEGKKDTDMASLSASYKQGEDTRIGHLNGESGEVLRGGDILSARKPTCPGTEGVVTVSITVCEDRRE